MKDTDYYVPKEKLNRVAAVYRISDNSRIEAIMDPQISNVSILMPNDDFFGPLLSGMGFGFGFLRPPNKENFMWHEMPGLKSHVALSR
jgi:hypothetical protein